MTKKSKQDKAFLFKFGVNLRKIRNQKNWSLEYTEEQGWACWQHLQKIETGRRNIELLTLKKLSHLYRVKISDLLKMCDL